MLVGYVKQYGLVPTEAQKERARMWVKALRQGGYRQGTAYLRSDERYCCLGVAREVLFPDAEWDEGDQLLTPEELETLGVTKPFQDYLVRLNDGEQQEGDPGCYLDAEGYEQARALSFEAIARVVEVEYGLGEGA